MFIQKFSAQCHPTNSPKWLYLLQKKKKKEKLQILIFLMLEPDSVEIIARKFTENNNWFSKLATNFLLIDLSSNPLIPRYSMSSTLNISVPKSSIR